METIDRLITHELHPNRMVTLTTVQLQELCCRAEEITGQIRNSLKLEPFSGKDSNILEQQIQGYQSGLIRLMNTVTEYQQPGNFPDKPLTAEQDKVYRFVVRSLDSLLSFIEQHFSRYFSADEHVPEIYIRHNRQTFAEKLYEIELFLISRIGTDSLIQIATAPIRDFIEHKKDNYSFRQLMYLKELVNILQDLNRLHKEDCAYSVLSEKLIYINFNSIDFINQFTGRIHEAVKMLATLDEKIEKLSWHLKEISQMHVRPDVYLEAGLPSVKEKIKIWLIEEIKHCRRVQSPESLAEIESLSASDKPAAWIWTASKTDLVELLYGLFYTSALNYGSPNLKQIAQFLEETFNVSLRDFYRTFLQIRYRKNRTVYLDRMKKILEEKMDELDEHPHTGT